MPGIVIKTGGKAHFPKPFGDDGTFSDRIILPGSDECRVKVTRFVPKPGFSANSIVYPYDETVYIVNGNMTICLSDGSTVELGAGDIFHVPAGEVYGINILADTIAVCVFSAGEDGTLPDNE